MNTDFPNVNNKLAFFDFDRTLVMHSYSMDYVKARTESYLMECVYNLTAAEEEYANDRPLPCMQWYAAKLYEEGYGLYCLTHEIFNLRDKLKQEQLRKFYPNTPMTYLTVDKPEHKIDMMKAIAMTECCNLEDVIFVDDLMSTVNQAILAGIDGKHLSNIVAMYESQYFPQEQDTMIKPKTSVAIPVVATKTDSAHMPLIPGIDDALIQNELLRTRRRSSQGEGHVSVETAALDKSLMNYHGLSEEELSHVEVALGNVYSECVKIAEGGASL